MFKKKLATKHNTFQLLRIHLPNTGYDQMHYSFEPSLPCPLYFSAESGTWASAGSSAGWSASSSWPTVARAGSRRNICSCTSRRTATSRWPPTRYACSAVATGRPPRASAPSRPPLPTPCASATPRARRPSPSAIFMRSPRYIKAPHCCAVRLSLSYANGVQRMYLRFR